jgi:hypothetical protein
MPVTYEQIELALQTLFTGLTVTDLQTGSPVAVPVFVSSADVELNPSRVYPSFELYYLTDFEMTDTSESDEYYDESVNILVTPNEAEERLKPINYNVTYSLHSWTKDAASDRKMMHHINDIIRPRDTLLVDGEYYYFWRTPSTQADVQDRERRIYHKVRELNVIAPLEENSTTTTEKKVERTNFEFGAVSNRSFNTVPTFGQVTMYQQGYGFTGDRSIKIAPVDLSTGQAVLAVDATFNTHLVIEE